MTKELLGKLKRDHRHKRLGGIARAMGLPYSTLYRIAMGQTMGSIATWEKIEAFYEAHEKICLKAECAGRMADETWGEIKNLSFSSAGSRGRIG